jgi:hypothetical protein
LVQATVLAVTASIPEVALQPQQPPTQPTQPAPVTQAMSPGVPSPATARVGARVAVSVGPWRPRKIDLHRARAQ